MSNSYKKLPIGGNARVRSDKWDKRLANRKLRRLVREAIYRCAEFLPHLREVSDVWSFNKDGKKYFQNADWTITRK